MNIDKLIYYLLTINLLLILFNNNKLITYIILFS